MRSQKRKSRLRRSARQNGRVLSGPSQGTTSTSRSPMCAIRQPWVPSVKVSPTRRSQTNSSSSSPIFGRHRAARSSK